MRARHVTLGPASLDVSRLTFPYKEAVWLLRLTWRGTTLSRSVEISLTRRSQWTRNRVVSGHGYARSLEELKRIRERIPTYDDLLKDPEEPDCSPDGSCVVKGCVRHNRQSEVARYRCGCLVEYGHNDYDGVDGKHTDELEERIARGDYPHGHPRWEDEANGDSEGVRRVSRRRDDVYRDGGPELEP